MKKIMFNDTYGLTQAVLDGRKTMTRRIMKEGTPLGNWDITVKHSRYQEGDIVAIAQKYIDLKDCDAFYEALEKADPSFPLECVKGEKGCYNKMFVKADWMPHHIRIKDICIERLQDISEKDALREGVYAHTVELDETPGVHPYTSYAYNAKIGGNIKRWWYETPRKAFAALIDKVSGKGTWDSNPWVWVYEFELVN